MQRDSVLECGVAPFLLPTSLWPACSSMDRRSKACRRRYRHTAEKGGLSRSHKATEKRTPGSSPPFVPPVHFCFDLGSLLRSVWLPRGGKKICVHLRNLRTLPSPILWGSISPGQLRLSSPPPRAPRLRVIPSRIAHAKTRSSRRKAARRVCPAIPVCAKFAKRKKRSPQISQIHADFFGLPCTDYGEGPLPLPMNSAASLSSEPGCRGMAPPPLSSRIRRTESLPKFLVTSVYKARRPVRRRKRQRTARTPRRSRESDAASSNRVESRLRGPKSHERAFDDFFLGSAGA